MRPYVVGLIGLPLALAACAGGGGAPPPAPLAVPAGMAFPAADSANAALLLNRLAFGPRPGDIAHVEAVGIAGWFAEQLNPSRLGDSAGDAALAPYAEALRPPTDLFASYGPPPRAELMDSAARRRRGMENQRLAGDVAMSALARYVASDRQLLEVMTEFWTNHFNVFLPKGVDRWLVADFVEHAIRPHALGRFEDLLVATAEHPAMLFYLDNAESVAPGARPPVRTVAFGGFRRGMMPGRMGGGFAPPAIRPVAWSGGPSGINENYARELMELHTLGVDGGYTQRDVIAVARIFTGWTFTRPRPMAAGGAFAFAYHDWAHDKGEKVVMGVTFPAGHGMDEGLRLLHILAESPATARHISRELCQRFVADAPPDGCVDAAAGAWARTHGDLRSVLMAIVATPDFWAPEHRARFKTPLEFLTSAVRAVGAEPDTSVRLAYVLSRLGEPLFMHIAPDGYPEAQADWLNSGAILTRMNVALALASGHLPGATMDLDTICPVTRDYADLVRRVNALVLGGQGSEHTLQVIREQVDSLRSPVAARALAVGLALGSPDFQRE